MFPAGRPPAGPRLDPCRCLRCGVEGCERTWLGEVAGLEQTLAALRAKKQHAELLTAAGITDTPRALS